MFKNIDVNIMLNDRSIKVSPCDKFSPLNIHIPADPSTAAFFIGAAVLMPGSKLRVINLLLNDTRIGFLKALEKMGCVFNYYNVHEENGEKVGDIEVIHHKLSGININSSDIPSIIDELPMLALIATQAEGVTKVSGAEELRVKESDRINAICKNLKEVGSNIVEKSDGFIINGATQLRSGNIDTFNDHRIAMTFHIASIVSGEKIILNNTSCVDISFPDFYKTLKSVIR
jgi:3-phosphoshikimate 1-carboxyvinyltransferase